MTDTKHTPGPWEFIESDSNTSICGDQLLIADVNIRLSAAKANANLIHAAPDLLESAEAVIKMITTMKADSLNFPLWKNLDAAIKKAKGQK